MEEEKGRKRRGETKSIRGKQQKWSNREEEEAAADFFFYVSDSASFLCISFPVSCHDNVLRMVRFGLCTKTAEEEIVVGLKIPGSVDTSATGMCPDASWIFLRTFADIFIRFCVVFKEHCGRLQLFSPHCFSHRRLNRLHPWSTHFTYTNICIRYSANSTCELWFCCSVLVRWRLLPVSSVAPPSVFPPSSQGSKDGGCRSL